MTVGRRYAGVQSVRLAPARRSRRSNDSSQHAAVLALQRTAGNRAVAALLAPHVQRLPETTVGDKDVLATAIGKQKASWIAAHPVEAVSVWAAKPKPELSTLRQLSLVDFRSRYPFPASPVPASSPPSASPLSGAVAGGSGGAASSAVQLPPASTPLPAPLPRSSASPPVLPASSLPPAPSPLSSPSAAGPPAAVAALPPLSTPVPAPITPGALFQQRWDAFKVRQAAALALEADKLTTITAVGSAVFGVRFQWGLIGPREYTNILARVAGAGSAKANLERIMTSVNTHAADAGLAVARKTDMITFYEAELGKVEAALALIPVEARARADALKTSTAAHYDPVPATKALLTFLSSDLTNHLVKVGARQSDYRSSYDKGESNTFGASWLLENTPFVIHIHAAGSGTILSAFSVKMENNQHGRSVLSDGAIKDPARRGLIDSLTRAAENPRTIALERRDGTPAPGRRL